MIGYYFYEYKVGMAQQIRVRSGEGEDWRFQWYVLCVHAILYLHHIIQAQLPAKALVDGDARGPRWGVGPPT